MQQPPRMGRRAFTVVELLVVIAVISILSALLYPVFAASREKARQTQCLSNQRQLGQAFMLYAQDYDEALPFFGDRYPRSRVFWPSLVEPYHRSKAIVECPSWPKAGKYQTPNGRPVAGEHGAGVNYGVLFTYTYMHGAFVGPPTTLGRLERPSEVMLLTDAQGRIHVYSPAVWPMTVDWDGDGVPDSNPSVLANEGPYNRGDPFRHQGGAICTFADGHARWVDARGWLQNRNDLWGLRITIN